MKNKFSFLSLFIVLSLIACQRPLEEEDIIFRGDWSSKDYALQIYSNGYGVCQSREWGVGLVCEGYVNIKGGHIIFTSNQEHSTLARKKFTIDQKPTVDSSGVTYMILEGERFVKH